jgi:hypothetical protein
MGQERFDLRFPHILGMTLPVEQDEPANPIDVGFLRPETVVESAQAFPKLV